MWEEFTSNVNFGNLNVEKHKGDRKYYTEYNKIRNKLNKDIASYIISNIELLRNFSYKLNSHPNQPLWDRLLRLSFYKGHNLRNNLQINLELSHSEISLFIFEDQKDKNNKNKYFKYFKNDELISLIESTSDFKMTTNDKDQNFVDKRWIGLKYDKNHPPENEEFLKVFQALVNMYYKIIKEIKMKKYFNIINYKPQLILYGPPGTGKTYEAKEIAKKIVNENQSDSENRKGYWDIIQFHPSYNYEDFVRGIQVEPNGNGISYKTVDRIFAKMCKDAQEDVYENNKYVLIIDEINRANLASVLGELIYALEYRGDTVHTPYAVHKDPKIVVPRNLCIIGTMNTADRSIGHIDYAVRRRFAFVPILPEPSILTAKGKKLYEAVEALFKKDDEVCLSPDFHADDVQPGHTYFMVKEDEKENEDEVLAMNFAYQLFPLLREYYKDGVLVNRNENGIQVKLDKNNAISIDNPDVSPEKIVEKVKGVIASIA
jgi:5-methylcytosine-specific restriction protein B